MQINRRRMLQRFVLLPRRFDHVGMTMADADRYDSAERIEISLSRFVPQILHPPFHRHDRLFVVEKDARVEELLAETEHFISRRAAVFFWLMVERRQVGKFHHVDLVMSGSETSLFDS